MSEHSDDDASSSSGSEFVPPEMLIAGRQKRATAGNRMARLLEQEDTEALPADDDFYQEHYGDDIFEEKDDEAFTTEDEDSEDEFDSDFTTDEEEEEQGDGAGAAAEDDGMLDEIKRRKNVYVDPLNKKGKRKLKPLAPSTIRKRESAAKRAASGEPKATKPIGTKRAFELREMQANDLVLTERRVSKRAPAIEKRDALALAQKQAQERKKSKKPKETKPEVPRKTLLDRLTEAVATEQANMESLQAFRRIEEDKKRTVLKRVALEGPIITVLSRKATKPDGTPYAEEFVTFSDESMLKSLFASRSTTAAPAGSRRRSVRGLRPPKLPSMMKTLDEADRSPYLDGSASESESRAAARGAAASAAASTAQPAAANGTAVGRRKGTRGASGTDTVEDGHAEPAAKTVKLEEPEAKSASSGPTGTRRSVRGGRPLELHTPEMKVFKTLGFAPDDATVV